MALFVSLDSTVRSGEGVLNAWLASVPLSSRLRLNLVLLFVVSQSTPDSGSLCRHRIAWLALVRAH